MKIFIACSKWCYKYIPEVKKELEYLNHEVILPNYYDDPFIEERIKNLSAMQENIDAISKNMNRCIDLLSQSIKGPKVNDKLNDIEKKNKEVDPKIINNYILVKKENDLQKLFENYVLFLSICPPELETKNMFNELKIKYKKELDIDKNILYIVEERLSDDIILIDNNLFNKFINYDIFTKNQAT